MKATTLAISCALFASLPASAATLNYSGGPSPILPLLPLFDPSIGTLNSVAVQFSGTQVVRMDTGLSGPQSVTYDAEGFYSVYVGPLYFDFTSPPNPSYPFASGSKGSGTTVIDGGGFADFTLSGSYSGIRNAPMELSVFSGPGTISMSPVTDPIKVTLSNNFSGSGFGQSLLSRLTSYSVTYDYTPFAVAVPEPRSWVMLIAGFGMAGWRMRRKTRMLLTR
jgi:PEP-CTERM motif